MKHYRSFRLRRTKRRLKTASWKYLPAVSFGILSLGSLATFFEFGFFELGGAANRAGMHRPGVTMLGAADGSTMSEVVQEAKEIAGQALEKTEVLRSQGWDASLSEQEWRQIEMFWQSAADKLAVAVSVEPGMAGRAEALALDELKTYYHDYSNRQDLTLAIQAYQQSVFIAAQLDPSDATLCDAQTRLSHSPEKWEMVVSLRQQSVDHLKAVARNVSFYDEQVVPLIKPYEEGLTTATRMHQRSPWYYAIQKAVCATEWGDRAKVSGEQADWAQSVAFWKEGIALLEAAPERIPSEIPNQYRESYQAAQDNLGLWKENLEDAEARVAGVGF